MLEHPRRVVTLLLLCGAFCAKKESAPEPANVTSNPSVSTTSAALPAAGVETTSTAATTASATAATTASPAGAITADGDTPGVTATLKELKRGSGGTLSLKLVITNASAKALGAGYNYGDPDHHIGDFSSFGGVQLIDPVGKKKYFVARDAEGHCVCSRDVKDIAPGASVNVWAKFPAPPDDVQKISVVIPHFSPMDDAPIAK
jgi:hypothetical protein